MVLPIVAGGCIESSSRCIYATATTTTTFSTSGDNDNNDDDGATTNVAVCSFDDNDTRRNNNDDEKEEGEERSFQQQQQTPPPPPPPPLMAMQTNASNTLHATIYMTYKTSTIVDLVVELSTLKSLVHDDNKRRKESNFTVYLSTSTSLEEEDIKKEEEEGELVMVVQPQIVFSSDDKYLSLLLPHPQPSSNEKHTMSTIILFDLIKPTLSERRQLQQQQDLQKKIPVPFFLQKQKDEKETAKKEDLENAIVPMAMNPRILSHSSPNDFLTGVISEITSICNITVSSSNNKSILLAGCNHGSVLAIHYKSCVLSGVLYRPAFISTEEEEKEEGGGGLNHNAIVQMVSYKNGDDDGRIAAIRHDGSVSLYASVFKYADVAAAAAAAAGGENSADAITAASNDKTTTTATPKEEEETKVNRALLHDFDHVEDHDDDDDDDAEEEKEEDSPLLGALQQQQQQQSTTSLESNGSNHSPPENQTLATKQTRAEKGGGGSSLMMRIEPIAIIGGANNSSNNNTTPYFTHAAWINAHLLALLTTPTTYFQNLEIEDEETTKKKEHHYKYKNVIAQVYSIHKGDAAILSELKMTHETLEECKHVSFVTATSSTSTTAMQEQINGGTVTQQQQKRMGCSHHHHHYAQGKYIQYDAITDSLSICSNLIIQSSPSSSSSHENNKLQYQPFACIWEYKAHVLGFTFAGDVNNVILQQPSEKKKKQQQVVLKYNSFIQRLYFVSFTKEGRFLIHLHSSSSTKATVNQHISSNHEKEEEKKVVTTATTTTIQEKIKLHGKKYRVGMLSPSEVLLSTTSSSTATVAASRGRKRQQQQIQQLRRSCAVEQPCPLLLMWNYIAFPFLSSPSVSQDSILEWKESHIPPEYIAACGPAQLAVMGRTFGRSIAVASDRGVCLLDLSRMRSGGVSSGGSSSSGAKQQFPSFSNPIYKESDGRDVYQSSRNKFSPCVEGFVCNTTTFSSSHSSEDEPLSSSSSGNATMINLNNNPKWRMFGNEKEEQAFRVVAMTWWERESGGGAVAVVDPHSSNPGGGGVSEDLLLAVVQYVNHDGGHRTVHKSLMEDEFYLVCWSRRRLGMGQDQLLEEVIEHDQTINENVKQQLDDRKGIPLPKGLIPGSISIISEPNKTASFSHSNESHTCPCRSLVLISSHFRQSNEQSDDDSVPFAVYQMQAVTKSNTSTSNVEEWEQIQHCVLARLCSYGAIPSHIRYNNDSSSSGDISGTFLAGGCFNFDFQNSMTVPSLRKDDHIATIGIIKTCGGGLDSVSITPDGPILCGRVIFGGHRYAPDDKGGNVAISSAVISKYWMSDVVHMNETMEYLSASSASSGLFVWSIVRSDGKVFSWSVPFFRGAERSSCCKFLDDEGNCAHHLLDQGFVHLPEKALHPPKLLPTAIPSSATVGFNAPCCRLLGAICCIGDDTVLMNGASTNDNEIALGVLPSSSAGCILYAGQHSRILKQNIPVDSAVFSHGASRTNLNDTLKMEVLSVGHCIVSTPAFTTSLFSLFLVAAAPAAYFVRKEGLALSTRQLLDECINLMVEDATAARESATRVLQRLQHEDAILMSLRSIILRVVDSISSAAKKMNINTNRQNPYTQDNFEAMNTAAFSNNQSLFLAKSLLYEVVSISKQAFDALRFSSLFLGIGRQLEPHHFSQLFPLPTAPHKMPSRLEDFACQSSNKELYDLAKNSEKYDEHPLSSVEDLFTVCVESGSLSTAASALPLYCSTVQSHTKCSELLHHCLTKIGHSYDPSIPFALDTSTEERLFVNQLFCFGIKLEDAEEAEESFDIVSRVGTNEEGASLSADNLESDDEDLFISSESNTSESQKVSSESDESTDDSVSCQSSVIFSESSSNSISTTDRDRVLPHGVQRKAISHGRVSRLIKMVSPVIWKRNREKDDLDEDEIHRAASSFILSGFDENEDFEEISYDSSDDFSTGQQDEESDDSTTGSCTSSKLIAPAQSFSTISVAGIVSKFLVCMALSDSICKCGWKKIAALAQLLLDGNQLLTSSTNSFVQGLLHDDLLSVATLQRHNFIFQDRSVGKESCDPSIHAVAIYFVSEIKECSNQIGYNEATAVFDLIIIILARYERCDVVKDLRTYLLLMGVIAGHVAGKVDEMLGQEKEKTSIGKCYAMALSKIDSSSY